MKYKVFGVGVIILIIVVYLQRPDNNLRIVACDVGQGDAFLLIYRNVQVVIDAGNPRSGVEECLDNHIPFWDRNIELIVISHPQLDHFGGLIEVLQSHTVEYVMVTELDNSTQEYEVLRNVIGGSGARIVRPRNGLLVRYGLMYLEVVWPTEDYVREYSLMKDKGIMENEVATRVTNNDLNTFSIVLIARLEEFAALFTGDIGPEVIDSIIETNQLEDVEYIKIPHHGSKNGLTKELLEITNPEVAVISVGEGNSFGHPHREVVELLSEEVIHVFRTDEQGEIEIVTNGDKYWKEKN